ncbi:MAG: hypothetical protein WDO12_05155 [Pseudomonadota bacterium]
MRFPSIRLWLPILAYAPLAACGSGDSSTSTSSTTQTVVAR